MVIFRFASFFTASEALHRVREVLRVKHYAIRTEQA